MNFSTNKKFNLETTAPLCEEANFYYDLGLSC